MASRSDRLTLVRREYEGSNDIQDADIVIAATDIPGVNSRVAADARALHRLVNVASAGEPGNFSSMAVHRSGPLVVGVSAGNVPAAAARIRDAIAERFDSRYAVALDGCGKIRAGMLSEKGSEEWARASRALFGSDFCLHVEEGAFVKVST